MCLRLLLLLGLLAGLALLPTLSSPILAEGGDQQVGWQSSLQTSGTLPSLQLRKTGPSAILATWVINYTIKVTNNTGSTMARIDVVDTLPAGQRFVSADQGGVRSGNKVRWTVRDLPAGATRTLHLRIGDGSSYVRYRITNRVRATSGVYSASAQWSTWILPNK